ncbi:predicted protein [Naegleria gruberi]|uniref:Predicted protein n=1 Tax=Naegleria gruberi TaxID=5762 RepID=D2V462_NAEGR|nr:uncharacterized protein NAEGRDRAFT_63608 [Naegleria gruberi]EFC48327.1 predicted protein [Naegleria gruberi]|eukprot:XP_002681071.1 predicted protein [Naegleria gruberi strain NEG-M]
MQIDENNLHLKDALVIYSEKGGINRIMEKLNRFFNNYDQSRSLFRKLDTVQEQVLNEKNLMDYLNNYQIIFISLFAGYNNSIWKREMLINLWYLVKRGKLMVVFLRSSLSKVAIELEVSRDNLKNIVWKLFDFMEGEKIMLQRENIIKLKSSSLDTFLESFENKEDDNLNIVSLSDPYVCGIDKSHLVNPNDWIFLGKQIEGEKVCWMIHKSKKIMFIPFYGCSNGNENQTNLIFSALKYLMFEHLEISLLQRNLNANRKILSDILINLH